MCTIAMLLVQTALWRLGRLETVHGLGMVEITAYSQQR